MPTRNARHGLLFTKDGKINIKNLKWKDDFSPIDAEAPNHTSRYHTKAYLRHLFVANEILGMQIATLHNLSFYLWLVTEARQRILDGSFYAWKNEMVPRLEQKL
jgi:queuine tRNA-ribosyltransferase